MECHDFEFVVLGLSENFLRFPICDACKKIYTDGLPDICDNTTYRNKTCNNPKPADPQHFVYKPMKVAIQDLLSKITNFINL